MENIQQSVRCVKNVMRRMLGKIFKTDVGVHQGVNNMVNENKCQWAVKVGFQVEFHALRGGGVDTKERGDEEPIARRT